MGAESEEECGDPLQTCQGHPAGLHVSVTYLLLHKMGLSLHFGQTLGNEWASCDI